MREKEKESLEVVARGLVCELKGCGGPRGANKQDTKKNENKKKESTQIRSQ